ncbi:MAG: DNA methyltransferase [Alphaproteobacteria bacterium]|nr:DNA methyltransferase [Alphaproteobacteria bacterium]
MTWPFGKLRMFGYGGLLIDPPWPFELYSAKGNKKSAEKHYKAMTFEDIAALPVANLMARDGIIGMWGTSPLLDRQIGVLKTWGFTYAGFIAWGKTTASGALRRGTGYRFRSCCELLIVGKIGEPPLGRAVDNLVMEQAREHSRKPDRQYLLMEDMAPNQLYAELFARQRSGRLHWDHWGNEVDKFGVAA